MAGSQDIAEHFADKYSAIYTSVPTDPVELANIEIMLQLQCLDNNIDDFRVRPVDEKRVCIKLKPGKSDGTQGFTSDHLKHASDKLFIILAMLINSLPIL